MAELGAEGWADASVKVSVQFGLFVCTCAAGGLLYITKYKGSGIILKSKERQMKIEIKKSDK
jgi:hypothetical protein